MDGRRSGQRAIVHQGTMTVKNEENEVEGLLVDTQSIESTFTEEYEGDTDNNEELITPFGGNSLVVHDAFIVTGGNKGTVSVDIGDKKVARLYGSQFQRAHFSNMTVPGEESDAVTLDIEGTDSEQKIFISINYIEVKGEME